MDTCWKIENLNFEFQIELRILVQDLAVEVEAVLDLEEELDPEVDQIEDQEVEAKVEVGPDHVPEVDHEDEVEVNWLKNKTKFVTDTAQYIFLS